MDGWMGRRMDSRTDGAIDTYVAIQIERWIERWIDGSTCAKTPHERGGRARLVCTLVELSGRSGLLGCELGSLLRHRKCTDGMSSISHTHTHTHVTHTHTPTHAHISMGHARGPHTSGRVLSEACLPGRNDGLTNDGLRLHFGEVDLRCRLKEAMSLTQTRRHAG